MKGRKIHTHTHGYTHTGRSLLASTVCRPNNIRMFYCTRNDFFIPHAHKALGCRPLCPCGIPPTHVAFGDAVRAEDFPTLALLNGSGDFMAITAVRASSCGRF